MNRRVRLIEGVSIDATFDKLVAFVKDNRTVIGAMRGAISMTSKATWELLVDNKKMVSTRKIC